MEGSYKGLTIELVFMSACVPLAEIIIGLLVPEKIGPSLVQLPSSLVDYWFNCMRWNSRFFLEAALSSLTA